MRGEGERGEEGEGEVNPTTHPHPLTHSPSRPSTHPLSHSLSLSRTPSLSLFLSLSQEKQRRAVMTGNMIDLTSERIDQVSNRVRRRGRRRRSGFTVHLEPTRSRICLDTPSKQPTILPSIHLLGSTY